MAIFFIKMKTIFVICFFFSQVGSSLYRISPILSIKIRLIGDTLNHITNKANFFGKKPYGAWKEAEIVRVGGVEEEAN
jgi:hypothetical protein